MSEYDLSRRVLDQVREAADIVTIVGEHLTLRKVGRNHVGLCPFHGEKTPSFNVSREKGTYYCFGCKRGGDVIDFVMELEHVQFAEAVERLAHRSGIHLPPASPEAKRRKEEHDQIGEVLGAAQAIFARQVSEDRPRAFLERRGVTLAAATEYGLGFARGEWRALHDALHRRYAERLLVTAGLVVEGEGERLWDRFRDRVTIPIRSVRGGLIAFGGRSVGDETPKYLNSPESAIFSKSHVLFALDRAVRAFGQTGRAIVVEGYFDCLALHQAGLTETVATLGTTLSEHHARELARRCPRVVVCFDGDAAGRQAAVNSVRTLLGANLDVSVLLLPQGRDPDDVARQEGAEAFRARVDAALSAPDFLLAEMGSTRQARRGNLLRYLEIVDACQDPVRRYGMREALARGAGVPLEQLGAVTAARVAVGADAPESLPPAGEMALLRSLLLDVPVERRVELIRNVPAEALDHPASRAIFSALLRRAESGETLEISAVTSEIDEHEGRRILAALEHEVPETSEEHLTLVMRELWEKHRKRRLAELSQEIATAEQQGQKDKLSRLTGEMQSLLAANRQLRGER